jgi:5-formyltetrahydrofolate cyclo-ligase
VPQRRLRGVLALSPAGLSGQFPQPGAPVTTGPATGATAKQELRRVLRAGRAARTADEAVRAGAALAAHAGALGQGPIAAFVGIRGEPPTLPLLAALHAGGVRVLLPLLREDMDLEWADYDGDPDALVEGLRGVLHPAGPSLGLTGIAAAALVLAPALAVDGEGRRLGQGGGSYDRALARTAAPVLAVVFDDELLERVPAEAHDRPVGGTLTPARGVRAF